MGQPWKCRPRSPTGGNSFASCISVMLRDGFSGHFAQNLQLMTKECTINGHSFGGIHDVAPRCHQPLRSGCLIRGSSWRLAGSERGVALAKNYYVLRAMTVRRLQRDTQSPGSKYDFSVSYGRGSQHGSGRNVYFLQGQWLTFSL